MHGSPFLAGFPVPLLWAAILLSMGAAASPTPLPQDATPATPARFGDIPGLTVSGPPPAWIEPGLRLTYHTQVGNLAGGPHEFVVDEKGRWVDAGGNHYRRKDVETSSSHGLMQANVVALGKERAAIQLLFFLFDGMNTAEPAQNLELGYTAPASTGGDLWMHPEALRELLAKGTSGIVATRVRKEIGLATYDAVMLFAPRPQGRNVWIYDLESGVLLYSSEITRDAGRRTQTGEQLSAGGSTVRFTTFEASRSPRIPWGAQPAPPWLAQAKGIRYRGSFLVRQPGLAETPLPFDVRMDVTARGPDWLQSNAVSGNDAGGAIPGLGTRVAGNWQLGGLWIPPGAMPALRAGQEIDRDPETKVTTRVQRADAQSVVIVQEGPRQRLEYTYRRHDGLLVRGEFTERLPPVPGMDRVIELELAGLQ